MVKDLIDDIILRETGGKPNGGYTNDPKDRGGRTQWGIAEKFNPEAWKDNKVDYQEARKIYAGKYLNPFKGLENHAAYSQLVDFGVTSGPMMAIMKLQELISVEVDGVVGPNTLGMIKNFDEIWVNNQLLKSRIKMVGRICSKDLSQVKYLNGWINRNFEFLL